MSFLTLDLQHLSLVVRVLLEELTKDSDLE